MAGFGSDFNNSWDDNYGGEYDDTYSGQNRYSSFFNQYLGEGVDIYDPQSIASGLMEKYDTEGLLPSMFPAMSRDLMEASDPRTYDAYKRMQTNPMMSKYRGEISGSAGVLNPNKRRKRALRHYRMGIGGLSRNIQGKTGEASRQIKNWMSNALGKVMRMKY